MFNPMLGIQHQAPTTHPHEIRFQEFSQPSSWVETVHRTRGKLSHAVEPGLEGDDVGRGDGEEPGGILDHGAPGLTAGVFY